MAVMSDGEFSQKLLAALPPDPFEQLELAQRITSRAVAAGVSKLETETGRLHQKLGEKDATILSMQHRMLDLERTLQDTSYRLSQALDGQLEMFKKNLLQSLQEDDDSVTQMEDIETASQPTYVDSTALAKGVSMTTPASRGSGSILRCSAVTEARPSQSPTRRSTHQSISSILGQAPKVDGKEFFRQARNRLSYKEFSAFLSNIKELNAHRQSREETLAKAEQIFGSDNQDLYYAFDGLITRHTT